LKRSTDRILTTHAGSLPRPDDLVQMMWAKNDGRPVEGAALRRRVREAVEEVVQRQQRVGLDVISDGEMSKPGFSNYVCDRYSGFGGQAARGVAKDLLEYPAVAARRAATNPAAGRARMPNCEGPIELRDPDAIQEDIQTLTAALGSLQPDHAFLPAPSPGQIAFNFPNKYYPSHEAYLAAAGNALRYEYRAIVEAGFNLQIDSPDLAMAGHWHSPESSITDFHGHIEQAVAALNDALADLPPDKLRLHVCWGNYPGPHHRDVELKDIVGSILKARPAFLYLEAANPRHEHEWEVWEQMKLPQGKSLIIGAVDVLTNHVEHPRLIAQRILRFAKLVARENVIAGTDCGFSTWAGSYNCDPDVAWLKLEALVQGASIASRELW